MKRRGIEELDRLWKRINTLRVLGRVGREDAEAISELLEKARRRILVMRETDENGDEVG